MYKRFLVYFSSMAFLIVAVLPHFLFYVGLGYQSSEYSYLEEAYQIKEHYAAAQPGRKIVLVSGSSTLYGIDAAMMERELGVPVVNFGLQAGLSRYQLERALRSMKSGDILILPLEYMFYGDNHLERDYVRFLMAYDVPFFKDQDFWRREKCIYRLPLIELFSLAGYRLGWCREAQRPDNPAAYVKANGDWSDYRPEGRKSVESLLSECQQTPFRDSEYGVPSLEAKAELADFIRRCHERDITVYAAWPPYLWRGERFTGSDLDAVHGIEEFYYSQGVKVLGNYYDSLYDVSWYYDTIYHLDESHKEIHTKKLLNELRPRLGVVLQ